MEDMRAGWPESYGFSIYGQGPSYVISVERNSIAHLAGICPGDQLIELDGFNVSVMSTEAIRTLARHSRSEPPGLGVASRVQFLELSADRRWGYGMTIKGIKPTLVATVDPPGPAYRAGIRPGDLVLEVEGHRIRTEELAASILRERYGKITLAMITIDELGKLSTGVEGASPGGRMIDTAPGGRLRSQGSRLKKARDIFSKMNVTFENDFEKKMALVGLLKQYAENRDIGQFSKALAVVLSDPKHRKLVYDIRTVIPLKHRKHFDEILNQELNHGKIMEDPSDSKERARHRPVWYKNTSQPRKFTVVRENGSFGFVLRGHSPVLIESVLTGGPADKAGLRPGDSILKINGIDVCNSSHEHLVRLLHGSGDSPTLEVQQSSSNQTSAAEDFSYDSPSDSSFHSSLSDSDDPSDWLEESSPTPDRKTTTAFQQQIDHLLTSKERSFMRHTLTRFKEDRNVTSFVDRLQSILDTPSKQVLWDFLIPRLNPNHQEYVRRRSNLNKHSSSGSPAGSSFGENTVAVIKADAESLKNEGLNSDSFKQQLLFLLTSRERLQLKKALQIYEDNRNIDNLIEDVSELLDTHSKRTLWSYILPLLSSHHQKYCQLILELPDTDDRPSNSRKQKSFRHKDLPESSSRRRIPWNFKDTPPATPRKGDIIYEKDNFLSGNFESLIRRISVDSLHAYIIHLAPFITLNTIKLWYDDELGRWLCSLCIASYQRQRAMQKQKKEKYIAELLSDDEDVIGNGRTANRSHSKTRPRNIPTDRHSYLHDGSYFSENENGQLYMNGPFPMKRRQGSFPGLDTMKWNPIQHLRNLRNQNENNNNMRLGLAPIRGADQLDDGNRVNKEVSPNSKVRMVRESSVQTTPVHQPNISQRLHSPSNSVPLAAKDLTSRPSPTSITRTNLLSEGGRDYRTIIKVVDETQKDPEIVSFFSEKGKSISSSPKNSEISQNAGSLFIVGKNNLRDPPLSTNPRFTQKIELDSERSVSRQNDISSFSNFTEAFQVQAQNVLKAFDEMVERELRNEEEPSSSIHVSNFDSAIQPPPPPPPQPPPPPPPLLVSTQQISGNNGNSTKSYGMAVKRINWEKLDKVDENTVWAKLNDGEDIDDVVKYLELEQQFSTKKSSISETFKDKKSDVGILNPRKAYNISILLGHLKMAVTDVKQALLSLDEQRLTPELLKQLLAFAPDADELEKFDEYRGLVNDLSEADQFTYQVSRVPGYKERLQAMVFKANFAEKVSETKELVLAMGNYMNKGNARIGDASGFRVSFLSQLDLTKTSDGKASFLHVLAEAVQTRFPESCNLSEDLPTIPEAAKVSNALLTEELAELRKVLQEISKTVNMMVTLKQRAGTNDRFFEIMEHFIARASDEIQGLFSLQAATINDFHHVVQYFGEDPKDMSSNQLFTVFSEFLVKFEKANQFNLAHKRKSRDNYISNGITQQK